MKKILFLSFILLASLPLKAQLKVAILETVDKGQNISYGVKLLLRSSLTSAISNTPGYEGYDRVDMASIAGEQDFQRTGNVSDDQIKQVGIATGAAYVLVAEAAKYDATSIIITAKILDVETFGVKSSVVQVTGVSANEMQQSCTELAGKLFGVAHPSKPNTKQETVQSNSQNVETLLRQVQSNSQNVETLLRQVQSSHQPLQQNSTSSNLIPLVKYNNGTVVYIATEDEPKRMNHKKAVEACNCKGNGWRLPTTEELEIVAKKYNSIGGFDINNRYWVFEDGKAMDFYSGEIWTVHNSSKYNIRCVKEAKQ